MVIASNTEKIVGKINVADRGYYKAVMAGDTYVSEVLLSRNSGNPVFFVSTPVPVKSLGQLNLLVAAAVIAIATVLIFFVTATVVKPINRVVAGLRDAAEGDGDLTKRIDIKSTDVVGEPARWFRFSSG